MNSMFDVTVVAVEVIVHYWAGAFGVFANWDYLSFLEISLVPFSF
jgi:hypothetical protein